MYVCKKCKKGFEYPAFLKKHMKKCNNSINEIFVEKEQYECPLCEKKYVRRSYFKNHVEKCKLTIENRPIQNITHNNYITNNIVDNSVKNVKNVKNVDNRVINNIIQFNLPGNESVGHIDQEKLLEILNHNFPYAIRELMRLTYFNKEVPENNKWCVVYPKEEYGALTYNHETENVERWITDQIVDDNFESMMFLISPVVDQIMEDKDLVVKLNEKQKTNLNLFYNYFGIEKLSKENPSDFKNIKMMAYNNRVIPIDLWKDLNVSGI